MSDHRASLGARWIYVPGQILLNADGEPGRKGAVDPVRPLVVVRVAVMGIEDGPVAIQEFELGRLSKERRPSQSEGC
jgi:hypothetical protein